MSAAPLEGKSEEGTLYEARSWPEVEAFLFGSSAAQPPPIEVCSTPYHPLKAFTTFRLPNCHHHVTTTE